MPFLLAGLVVGLLVSVFQAVTSIQEQTLSFIPKILVIGAVLAIGGPVDARPDADLHPEPVHEHPQPGRAVTVTPAGAGPDRGARASCWCSARVGGLFVLAPVFSAAMIPMRIKLMLAMAISLALMPIAMHGQTVPLDAGAYAAAAR